MKRGRGRERGEERIGRKGREGERERGAELFLIMPLINYDLSVTSRTTTSPLSTGQSLTTFPAYSHWISHTPTFKYWIADLSNL